VDQEATGSSLEAAETSGDAVTATDLEDAEALLGSTGEEDLLPEGLQDILEATEGADSADAPEVVLFDFNRPHNLSKSFEQNMRNVAENFAKLTSFTFANLLRANASLEFSQLSLRACGDFLAGLGNPTCLCLVSMAPLKGQSLIHMDLSFCFTLLKKLMGGSTEKEDLAREFTEIEKRIVQNVVGRLLSMFRDATAKLAELTPEYQGLENNPDYLTGMAIGDTIVILKFIMKLESQEGDFHICIPLSGFEPLRQLFDPVDKVELRTPQEVRRDRRQILELIQGTESELVVRFNEVKLSLQQVVDLKVGDVIPLAQPVKAPLVVTVAGKPLFLGEPGRINQFRAVKLMERIPEE
jgi:flagellar motor switch protein FliM